MQTTETAAMSAVSVAENSMRQQGASMPLYRTPAEQRISSSLPEPQSGRPEHNMALPMYANNNTAVIFSAVCFVASALLPFRTNSSTFCFRLEQLAVGSLFVYIVLAFGQSSCAFVLDT